MKYLSRIGSLVWLLVGILSFSSCTIEDLIDSQTPEPLPVEGSAEISFMSRIPTAPIVSTRATESGTVAENRIEDIYVLVFQTTGSQELVYKGKGKELVFSGINNDTVRFKATLPVGKPYDFMVLANVDSLLTENNINITEPAKTKADVEAILQEAISEGSVYQPWSDPIPMWDEQRLTLSASQKPKPFNLMRMMARVQVSYEPAMATENYFKLTNVRYYNYNTVGKLVPDTDNLEYLSDPDKGRFATDPTLPSNPGTQTDEYLAYTATADTCKNKIYVFEAANKGKYSEGNANWIGNPCLVVGGVYDTDKDGNYEEETTTWYRIDFIRNANTNDETWLSILRNFTYNVVITSVSGQGYADADEALRSAPMNLTAGVMDWNDGDMDLIYFDGMAYLSVDKNDFRFERDSVKTKLADESNVLRIRTDYTVNGYPQNSGWHAEYFEADGVTPMTDANRWLWLQNPAEGLTDKGSPTGAPSDDPAVTHFTFTQNTTTENREACVYIVAGRLRYRVRVIQRLLSLKILDKPSTQNGVPVTEFFEVVPRTSPRPAIDHTFVVEWEPIADDVTTGNESPLAFNPFYPEWITPNTLPAPGATGILSGSGTQTYVAHFPVKTDEELYDTADPFYERESTYTFKIDNGLDPSSPSYDYVEKSVRLHQIYYNIIVDVSKYRLDGSTHTLTVRSNTDWEITKIEEWLYNVNPEDLPVEERPTEPIMLQLKPYDNMREGTTGGNNVNGEAIAFTVVNNEAGAHDGKFGTVWVTFHSPTGKFPDERVPLVFPAASRLLMGLGYFDRAYAVNPAYPTDYHNNSAFNMLISPYNFGSMEESIYQVEGFRVVGHNAQGNPDTNSPTADHADRDWHPQSMVNWLNTDNPDVIVLGDYSSDTYTARYTEREIQLLKQYVDNGGALIVMNHGGGGSALMSIPKRFLEVLLDKPQGSLTSGETASGTSSDVAKWISSPASGGHYQLANVDDPVLNGPFGDVRGLFWGAHYYRVGIKTSLLGPDVVSLSNGLELSDGRGNEAYTTIFRHTKKNVLFIGNGSFVATNYPSWQQDQYPEYGPFYCQQTNFFIPGPRTNWGPTKNGPKVTVQNSILFANAVAWALGVTNHTPPAGGYVNP